MSESSVQPPPAEAPAALTPAATEDAKAAEIAAETAAPKQTFKQALIDKADVFAKSAGLISYDEANQLWAGACDGPGVTQTEFDTLAHILDQYKFTSKARQYLDPLVHKQVSGSSLYKQINKVRYDRSCLDLADHLAKDGKIDLGDAKKLWEDVMDGNRVTDTEKRTIEYVRDNFTLTDGAKEFFGGKLAPDEAEAPGTPTKAAADDADADTADTPGRRSARKRTAPTKFEPPEPTPSDGSRKGKKRKKESAKKKKPAKKAKKASKKAAPKKKAKKGEPVYCCGEPYDDSQFYMGCSSEADCKGVEWYHGKCLNPPMTAAKAKAIKDWFCEKCIAAKEAGDEEEEDDGAANTSIFDDGEEDEGEDQDDYTNRMLEENDEGDDEEDDM